MSRSISGRSRVARPVTRRFAPPRGPAIPTTPLCIGESFDQGAEWPLGPDQTWEFGTKAASVSFASVQADGTDPDRRTLHVVGNELRIRMPEDSELPDAGPWGTVVATARAADELSTTDMRVSATVSRMSATIGGDPSWWLVARSVPTVTENLEANVITGWSAAFYASGFVDVFLDYVSSVYSPGTVVPSYAGGAAASALSEGDEIGLEVTGTGTLTVVTFLINDVTQFVYDQSNSWGGTDVPQAGDSPSDFTEGFQGGLVMAAGSPFVNWNKATMDDTMAMDDWQACPA